MARITEKVLLDNYDGITNGLHLISIVDGKTYYWNYRRNDTNGHSK